MVPLWLSLTYIAFVGACVGSFLNVVVARLPAGLSVVRPRSRCPGCESTIAWYDNLPIVSWVWLRARCRSCGTAIAFRYPLVELLTAAIWVAVWSRFGWTWELALWWPLASALLAITFLDIDHWWVPDVITFPAMALALGASVLPDRLGWAAALVGLLPAGLLWLVGWGFERLTGREGMGLGDIKLLAVIGLALGAMDALTVLVVASVQGALVGALVLLTGGHRGVDDPPPENGDERESDAVVNGIPVSAGMTVEDGESEHVDEEEDDWVPPKGAFPFGPFLVLGTFEVALLPGVFGDLFFRLSQWSAQWLVGGPPG